MRLTDCVRSSLQLSFSFCKYEWNKRALHQLLTLHGPVSSPPHYFCPVFVLPFQILFYHFEEKQQTGERVSQGLGTQGRSSSARLPGICRAAHSLTHTQLWIGLLMLTAPDVNNVAFQSHLSLIIKLPKPPTAPMFIFQARLPPGLEKPQKASWKV